MVSVVAKQLLELVKIGVESNPSIPKELLETLNAASPPGMELQLHSILAMNVREFLELITAIDEMMNPPKDDDNKTTETHRFRQPRKS